MWTTDVYQDGSEADRRDLSTKMAHNQRFVICNLQEKHLFSTSLFLLFYLISTAQRWYDLTERRESATKGFLLIEKRQNADMSQEKDEDEPPLKKTKVQGPKRYKYN